MKKHSILAIAIVIAGVVGFWNPLSARAAEPMALTAPQAALVQSTLAATQTLLNSIQSRLADTTNPFTTNQKIVLSDVLGGLRTSLLGISATIGGTSQAQIPVGTPSGTPTPETNPSSQGSGAGTQPSPAPTTVTQPTTNGNGDAVTTPAENNSDDNGTEDAGTTGTNKKQLLWLALAIIAVVAGNVIFRLVQKARMKKEMRSARRDTVPATTAMVPPSQPVTPVQQPQPATPSTQPGQSTSANPATATSEANKPESPLP